MLAASDIKTQNINNTNVETEIALLNLNVIRNSTTANAVSVGMTANTQVHSSYIIGTPMSNSAAYYSAWQNNDNALKVAEMNSVISYFQGLGFTINRKSNNNQNLYWYITW